MKLSGKKLTTAILAGLMGATMFGGSVFAEVSDQEFNEVRQGVNANSQRLDQLESAQKQAKDYSKDIAANTTAIAKETTARTEAGYTDYQRKRIFGKSDSSQLRQQDRCNGTGCRCRESG